MTKLRCVRSRSGLAIALSCCAIGCVGERGDYPSLAIRDVERVATGEVSRAAASSILSPTPADPTISPAMLTDILARAKAINSRFGAVRDDAALLVRRAVGSGRESDLRARAHIAMADLVSLRGQTAIMLADLDLLEVDAASALAPTIAIQATQDEVAAIVEAQDEAIANLDSTLDPSP